MLSVADLSGLQLFDVTAYVIPSLPGGVFSGLNPQNVNKDVWKGLTPAQRRILLEASARGLAGSTWKFNEAARDNLAVLSQKNIKLFQPTAEMRAASDKFVESDLAVIGKQFASQYGIANVEAEIKKIQALAEKWKGLVAGIGNDEEKLADLYWKEILSKVNVDTYGVN
jgi:hypothetical protein